MALVLAPALESQVKPEFPVAASSMAMLVALAPVILAARAFGRVAMLALVSLLLEQPPKMAPPALPAAGWRRPTSADKHSITNSACEFEPAHPGYRLEPRRGLLNHRGVPN
jgi:hypothetical protein